MATKHESMKPASNAQAPNPAHTYERTDPARETAQGKMSSTNAPPAAQADQHQQEIKGKNAPRGLNAHDVVDQRKGNTPARGPDSAVGKGSTSTGRRGALKGDETTDETSEPDHSMFDEEPLGADQAPQDIQNPEMKRHPRKEGKGGTP